MMVVISTMTMLAAAMSVDAPPPAGWELVQPAFASTILSTYPDGRISKLWINRDGTFSAEGRSHEHQGGRWTIRGHSLCMSQLKPFPIPFAHYCAPIPASGVTASWTGKAVTGEPITIRLTPGR